MKIIPINQLYKTNFDCEVFSCLRQQWTDVSQFSCINTPKADELLLYLCGYEATYFFPDGTTKRAPDHSAIYSPSGSEYLVKFKKITLLNEDAYTIGIRFSLLSKGERIKISDDITIFENASEEHEFFTKELFVSKKGDGVQAEKKAALLELLAELGKNTASVLPPASPNNAMGNFETIRASYDFLNAHYESEKSLEEIAAMSFVSPVWFRKLFKEKTGVSPIEYRTELRLKQARNYLQYGNMSVREIAESVGYSDISLFIKHFKRLFGMSPLALRKRLQSQSPEL